MTRCLAFAAILALSGCGAIQSLNSASQPLDIYELRTPVIQTSAARRGLELTVEAPISSGSLETDRIMIRPGPTQAQYLPGARWPDPAPEMVQTLILRSLLESGALGSVGRRPVGTVGDFALLSELTDFQAEDMGDDAIVVRVRLIARLVRERDARVVATRRFEAVRPSASARPGDVVEAFDAATGAMVGELVPWVLSRL